MPKKHSAHNLFSKLLIFVLMCGVFFTSSVAPAYAQWASTNPDTLANDLASTIQENTSKKVEGALVGALAGIGINLLDYVATLTAQSTAVWIASGGAGKHPLFNSQTMEEVGVAVSGSVVSDVLDQIMPGAGVLVALGIDPNNPDLTGVLRKMLGSSYKPVDLTEDGRMDGGSIGRNFSSYIASTAALTGATQANDFTAKILTDTMNASSMNEFYGLMRAYGQTTARAGNLASTTEFTNIIKDGFQDLKSPISKKIKWPAANVKKKLDDAVEAPHATKVATGRELIAAAGKDAVIQVGINFLTTFAGTLFGELTNKLFTGLLDGIDPVTVNPFDPTQVVPGRSGEELFRSLGTFRPLSATGFSLTAQLASCPATLLRNTRGIYTCAMDTSFVSVVARGNSNNPSTLEEAINTNEINGSLPLVGPDSSTNKDPNCYQKAYCHSNLLKLRKARIVPVGWEMAAVLSGEGKYTLKQVMDGFYDCNKDGARDSEHEFCKLIDPKWVLRAPTAVCRTLAYGQQLATSAGPNRMEECVDIQTCLDEDENGECKGGYGYCVREANIWRFRGDSCSEENASCQALTDRGGKAVSYLLNTVDYATCGPDKVGCQWFETAKTVDDKGTFDWPVINNVVADQSEPYNNQSRIYTNATVQTCEDGGCHELFARSGALTLNMVQNGSFEDDKNSDGTPDGWLRAGGLSELKAGKGVANGVALEAESIMYPGLVFEPGRSYAISFSSKVPTGGVNMDIRAEMVFMNDNPQDDAGIFNIDFSGYSVSGLNGTTCEKTGDTITITRSLTAGDDYVKSECLFTVPNLPDTIRKVNGSLQLAAKYTPARSKVWFDDVQIEQRGQVSSFAFGYSTNAPKTYAKIAPAYLGCSGAASDSAECAKYAKVCSPIDEGCQQYTPTNGDPAVNAIVGDGNACPAVCTGYDTFKQEPSKPEMTQFEPDGVFPVYFIPATAKTCSEDAAGCDEFTNLTSEKLEYFTYLRGCLSPERATTREAVYYTWEGSDVEGYQIKTWHLLKTNIDYAVNLTASTSSSAFDANAKDAPCTSWSASDTGIVCADDSNTDQVLDSMDSTCNERADIYSNPDCREFYDSVGQIHYRLWSKTVSVDNACTSYRKTDIAGVDSLAQARNCNASGGYYAAGGGSCIYYGFSTESKTCSAAENGCRIYTGGRGNNARTVFADLFEKDGTTAAGIAAPTYLPGWDSEDIASVSRSTESLANEGHSLKVTNGKTFWSYYANWDAPCGTAGGCVDHVSAYEEQCRITKDEQYCGTLDKQLFTGKTYTIQFWAKGTGTVKVGFAEKAAANEAVPTITAGDLFRGKDGAADIQLTSEWKQYSLGPIDMNAKDHPDFGIGSILVFDPSAGSTIYVDTISLREGEENLALIRDSWSTPAVCDTDATGFYAPQFNLGCRQYNSSAGSSVYLKSFTRLCGEDKVGCAAFYDTQASESPYGQVFNAYCNRVDSSIAATETVECRLETDATAADGYAQSSQRLCTLQPNQTSCRFNLDFLLPKTALGISSTSHIVYGSDTEIVNPDAPIYAVVNSSSQCNSADAGCTEVGVPVLSADQSRVESWGDVSLLLDPDSYGTTLCRGEDLFCEEFNDARKNKYYFKDPQQKVCEFKDKVVINNQEFSGWFVKGTTNFCYGEGKCAAHPTTSCTLDSDCPVVVSAGGGTCSVFGTACSQDTDCRLNERCLGVTSDKCVIEKGSYIVSGTESGLWLTGDDGYKGWAGTCSAENSGCREFLDPLDNMESDTAYGQTKNKSYYYIENENLGDVSIGGTTQRCNGQASTEEGCVLFNDTSLPRQTMSTTATAIASQHADELFGTRQYALVPPINCDEGAVRSSITTPNGSKVDLCANRCAYDRFKVEDIGTNWDNGTTATTDDAHYNSLNDYLNAGLNLNATNLEKGYVLGGSCLVDNDCQPVRSESGDLINGSCRSVAPNALVSGALTTLQVPRLTNDTNRVIKVNRNRTCSEWIAPDECRKVWDPELNQFRQSCSRLVLCEEYDETGVFACKKPKANDAAVPVNLDFYTSRDASWYGNDYSGYAIGNEFLLNHLTQEQTNIARVCVLTTNDGSGEQKTVASTPLECTDTSQCGGGGYVCEPNPDPKFALAYNAGSCKNQASNTSCKVGSCADSGATCATASQCPGSRCVIGTCIIPTTQDCTEDADCGVAAGSVCVAGKCEIEVGSSCLIQDAALADKGCIAAAGARAGAASATCRLETSSFKEGTCINSKCLLTPVGDAYPKTTTTDATIETFGKVCRANPEADSPFATDVVEKWNVFMPGKSPADAALGQEAAAYPYNSRSGYENANVCADGQACTCSYKKLTASGQTGYVEINETAVSFARLVAKSLGAPSQSELGICSGGPASGAFCVISGKDEYGCRTVAEAQPITDISGASAGICNPIQREDDLVGLRGYCLERDSAVNVNGDQNLGACLTYFPIDELRGETDLYGKYKEAGYFKETFYCADVKNYANVKSFRGCAANLGTDTELRGDNLVSKERTLGACKNTVACPKGYWALVGPENREDNGTTYQSSAGDMCIPGGDYDGTTKDGNGLDLWTRADVGTGKAEVACPYMCVPNDSVQTDVTGAHDQITPGTRCTPPGTTSLSKISSAAGYSTPYVYTKENNGAKIDDWFGEYDDCTYFGMDLSSGELGIKAFYDVGTDQGNNNVGTPADGYLDTFVIPRNVNFNSPSDTQCYLGRCEDIVTQSPYENADFYPACQDVVQVGDNSSAMPYTDRLYQTQTDKRTLIGPTDYKYSAQTLNRPFGATKSPEDANHSNYLGLDDPHPLAIPTCTLNVWLNGEVIDGQHGDPTQSPVWWLPYQLGNLVTGAGLAGCTSNFFSEVTDSFDKFMSGYRSHAPDSVETDGVTVKANFGNTVDSLVEALPFIPIGIFSHRTLPTVNDTYDFNYYDTNAISEGIPRQGAFENYVELSDNPSSVQTMGTRSMVRDALDQIFAIPLKLWSFDSTAGLVDTAPGLYVAGDIPQADELSPSKWDTRISGTNGYAPEPPKIYAVDSSICSGRNCREGGENEISVNQKVGEDFVVDTDGYFRAYVEFFAAAAKEQLPIRRIIVDWGNGDQSGASDDQNFYKNFRGLDKNNDDTPFCDSGSEWGMTAESCEPTWLRYTKTYVCDDAMAENVLPVCGSSTARDGSPIVARDVNCYDPGQNECVFQPKVHVRDNWGWCAGQCDGHDAGCFSSQGLTAGTTDASNQCNYQYFPHGAVKVDPWVSYSGKIRIKKN